MDAIIDGTYTLGQTLSALQYREKFGYVLTSLSQGQEHALTANAAQPVNYASFSGVPSPPKALDLIAITDPPGAASVIATKAAQGWSLVVYSTIYIQSKPVPVAAFRKN